MRTGTANLPLHYGKAPRWLFDRMTKLAGEIATVIVEEHGTEDLLHRHPGARTGAGQTGRQGETRCPETTLFLGPAHQAKALVMMIAAHLEGPDARAS